MHIIDLSREMNGITTAKQNGIFFAQCGVGSRIERIVADLLLDQGARLTDRIRFVEGHVSHSMLVSTAAGLHLGTAAVTQ